MEILPENAEKYWERPPTRDKGDSQVLNIHTQVGIALSLWEGIEHHFVGLFCHFIEPRISHAAERAYGSISSSEARNEALINAAEVYFRLHKVSNELQSEFALILKHFRCARGRRNEIAHAVTMRYLFENEDAGAFLIPALYSSRKIHAFNPPEADRLSSVLKNKYRYTSADIEEFILKFRNLEGAILQFRNEFSARYPFHEDKALYEKIFREHQS